MNFTVSIKIKYCLPTKFVSITLWKIKKDTLIGKGHSNYLKRPLGGEVAAELMTVN